MSENTSPPKKRRWYHNLKDAYTITARTYSWIGWAMGGLALVVLALSILIAALTDQNWILWGLFGVMAGLLAAITLLSFFVRRAMYTQVDGTTGAVYAVVSQIRSGWIVSDQPQHVTRDQDLVWRIIGRPGVVLISEGPASRAKGILDTERRKISRVMKNVPIHTIQVGHDEGQIPLAELESRLRKLKKVLTREEVPAVSARLAALSSTALPIPKGIDPTRARPSRRALRGK
ncbi:MAG: DUF4191 domain-containing protein [Actinomycetaceae bacterium]|nr:DUF4191 domain-containing protein [Actinomycetaceae bacterium]